MKETLEKEIKSFLEKKGIKNPKVRLTPSVYLDKGDYSTNVAMAYAKELRNKPIDLAEEITLRLTQGDLLKQIKIRVVAPGFINFSFDKEYFGDVVKDILKDSEYGKNEHAKGYKVFIEHTQPNPFKTFHIGHLMNNTIGESVARIVKANGAEVQTATYHGDVGLHVAKAVWALKQGISIKEAYAFGHKAYEDDEKAKREITKINTKIYDESDPEINKIYEGGRQESVEYFEKLYEKLDNHFDYHFFESESGEVGKELVLENVGKVFEKGVKGAVIFKGENFEPKTHTRVFLNSEGLPTYEAKELGLAQIKKDWFSYDMSITVTANEQDSFFKVVEVAIGEVFPDLKGKLTHLSHGLLKLPTGKMSSREGNIISAEALIQQTQDRVLEKMWDSGQLHKDIDDTQKVILAEQIAIGAIKYSILRQAIGGDIIFDFDKSISFEGDSGPYLQYSAVRAKSVLKKSEKEFHKGDPFVKSETKLPSEWETTNLERYLERFPDIVARAGMEYAPHHIATYLIELAGEFNSFYASHKIIDVEDKSSSYRLAITKVFVQVMASGLNLLGIKIPEKM
ncbi:MAG: arginine--tRNA ligase [Minisyncoccia bacterium]